MPSTDEKLRSALAEANSYLDLQLTYTFTPDGGSTESETLDRATLGSLYYLDEDDMSVQVDEEILGNLVNELAEKHVGTTGKTSKFKTTGGSYININVAREGQSVDATALYNEMLECLKSKTGGTRTAPYTAASDSGDSYWGGNYVETRPDRASTCGSIRTAPAFWTAAWSAAMWPTTPALPTAASPSLP